MVTKFPRKSKEIKVNITVETIPHPDPQSGIDLVAGLVLKQILLADNKKD